MKLILSFLATLCLFLNAAAQESPINKSTNPAASGTRIGQPVPDVLITGVSGLTIGGKPVSEFHLSQLRGKLVILDFWATWCAPCRKMIPVMDSLQRAFKNEVQFLPVSYESEKVTAPVLAAMQKIKAFQLPEVTSDVALNKLFPHRSLPHYAWISETGILLAETEEKEITAANIRKILSGKTSAMAVKRDSVISYDPARPLLLAGNGGDGSGLIYHSLLTRYKPGLNSGTSISAFDEEEGQRFTARNVTFPWICRMAYGGNGRTFPRSRTLLLSKDSLAMDTRLTGQAYNSWLASGNGWCYELALPPALAASAYPFMQADLPRLFPQYTVTVEKRRMPCLALVRTGTDDKLQSGGGETTVAISPYKAELHNARLSQLMMRLERQYLQNSQLPVVDATKYTGRVDLSLEARLYDVADLNRALAPYGLAFIQKTAEVEVLVISDAPANNNQPKTNPKS
jgi:thiol-disulfide isomerase/thioredoxin